jgi:hypothetical protein
MSLNSHEDKIKLVEHEGRTILTVLGIKIEQKKSRFITVDAILIYVTFIL